MNSLVLETNLDIATPSILFSGLKARVTGRKLPPSSQYNIQYISPSKKDISGAVGVIDKKLIQMVDYRSACEFLNITVGSHVTLVPVEAIFEQDGWSIHPLQSIYDGIVPDIPYAVFDEYYVSKK